MKKKWRKSEVISFLEDRVISGEADENEMLLYEQCVWDGFINELNYNTYRNTLMKMNREYDGE